MASREKLWFDVGIRDNITKELERILKTTNDVAKALSIIGKDPLVPGIKNSYDNLEKLDRAIASIGGTLSNLRSAKIKVTDPKDLTEINNMRLALGKMRAKIKRFREEMSTKPGARNEKGLAEGFLSIIGYDTAITQVSNRIKDYLQAQRAAANAARENAQANQGLVAAYDKVAASAKNLNNITRQIGIQIASTFSLWSIEHFVKNLITVGGEFEVQHIALQNILGDIQQANSMFEQMKELAVVSPFNFRQLASYAKQVAAFNVPYEEMFDTTKRLADISAGLGVDMGRLILAYGQVRSAAVLRGQELRQFTEAGIPLVQALANEFSKLNGRAVATAEVFELISKRAVPFEMVKKILWDMTNEGGRFYDTQFVLADTLAGKWSNLQDAWEIMLSEISKGESIGGKALKLFVSLTTSLIEGMSTLAPIITTIVTGIGAIKLKNIAVNFGNLGFKNIDANIQKAQQLRAIELTRQKINGEISAQKYKQLMAMNAEKNNYYQLLAMEGRLNILQIQKLYKQGAINKKHLEELVLMKLITKEQKKQIINGKIHTGTIANIGFHVKNLGKQLWAFSGWAGVVLLAIDAVVTGLVTWYNKVDEIERKNNELVDGFRNKGKELSDALGNMNTPSSDEDYKGAIDGMKEMLKQHSANYDAVMLEVNAVDDLSKKYELLNNALVETKDVYGKAELLAADFAEATRSSFDEVKVWARELSKNKGAGRYEFSFGWDELGWKRNEEIFTNRVKKLAEKIKEVVPNVGNDSISNSIFRQLRNSLEQELGVGAREKLFIDVKLNELLHIQDDDSLSEIITERFANAVAISEPRIANKIRYGGGKLEDAEKEKVKQLIHDAAKETEKAYPEFANTLQKLLNDSNFYATIQLRYAQSSKSNDLQNQIYQNFGSNVSIPESTKNMSVQWGTSGSWYDARNNAKRDIDKIYNDLVAIQDAKEKGKAKAEDVTKLNTKYENAVTAALIGLGYDYKGEKKKSNKEPKGSKTDQKAKEMREQIKLVKDAYSWYKKYKDDLKWSPEAAFAEIQGKYGDLLSKIGVDWSKEGDIEGYSKSLHVLLDEAEKLYNQPAHKNSYMLDVIKELKDALQQTDFDAKKEEMQNFASEVELSLKRMTDQWNLYKTIRESTGDRNIAAQLAGVNGVFTNMADALKERITSEFASGEAIDFASVLNMDDKAIKDYVAKLGLTGQKAEGIINALKQWRDLQKNLLNESITSYAKMLTDADALKTKIDQINDGYQNQIDRLNTLRGSGKIGDDEYNARSEQASRERSLEIAEQLVNGVDWSSVSEIYGNVLTGVAEQLKHELDNLISEDDFKKLNITQQKSYLDLRSKLDSNDGTVTSPFNISAWKDMNDHLKKYQKATSGAIAAARDYAAAMKDEQAASEALTNAKTQEAEESAKAALEDAKNRKKEANARLKQSQSTMQQEGQEFLTTQDKAAKGLNAFGDALQTISSGKLSDFVMGIDSIIKVFAGQEKSKTLEDALTSIMNSLGLSGNKYAAIVAAVFNLIDVIGDDMGGFVGDIIDKIVNLITGIFEDIFSGDLLKEVFNAIGKGIGNILSSVVGGFGKNGGPFGFIWNNVKGIFEGLFGGLFTGLGLFDSDEDLQEMIESSQRQVEVLERISDILEKKLEYALGGVYAYRSQENSDLFARTAGGYKNDLAGQLAFQNFLERFGNANQEQVEYLKTAIAAFEKAEQTGEYYDQQRALLYAQKSEIQKQIDYELDKKDSDQSAINNYKEQIEDLDLKIQTFALDMAEALYGIDLKSWASELTDAVVSAWEAGEDAEEAYLKKGKEIIKDLAKTVMQQKIMEIAFKNVGIDDLIANMMDAQNGKLNYDNVGAVGEAINQAGVQAVDAITAVLDYMEAHGWIEKGDGTSSTSSKVIQGGFNENETGLVLSYMNAMRADLSIQRADVFGIRQFLEGNFSQMPVLAQAQLQQLQTIAANTGRNASFAEDIYNLLHKLAPDGQRINVR